MKIDRLFGIVIYLLNREIVNTNTLAERFEVSSRTIQRDIETLSLAGIPIISVQGINGGYGIIDSYKLERQIVSVEDYRYIITALMGMCSAYTNKKIETTIEKFVNISGKNNVINPRIKLDLSVSQEGNYINDYIEIIEKAIDETAVIQFDYTNSYGEKKQRLVEPVGVIYKWYAWYMLGYCREKMDYRLFKIIRMRELKRLDLSFSIKHESLDKLLLKQEKEDHQKYIDVKLLFDETMFVSMEEYFPKGTITPHKDRGFMLEFTIPEQEIGWKGILFSFGNKVKILEPEELKKEFKCRAEEIMKMYK